MADEGEDRARIDCADAPQEEVEDLPPDKASWKNSLRPIMTTLDIVSKTTRLIPVVGSYIQCGVDVAKFIVEGLDVGQHSSL